MWIPSPTHRESDIEGLAYCSGTMVFINMSTSFYKCCQLVNHILKKKSYSKKTSFSGEKVGV